MREQRQFATVIEVQKCIIVMNENQNLRLNDHEPLLPHARLTTS